jgi:hypothetical protein
MCEYKNLPVWQMAFDVGRQVHRVTDTVKPCNALIASLREHSEALPVCIAIGSINHEPDEFADALRQCFTHAHAAEMLLFVTLAYKRLAGTQAAALLPQMHALKRLVLDQYIHTKG